MRRRNERVGEAEEVAEDVEGGLVGCCGGGGWEAQAEADAFVGDGFVESAVVVRRALSQSWRS